MSTVANLRAGLYERVSILARGGGDRSVREQNAAGEERCRHYRWQITERYADPGRSASRFATRARPEYERLLADIAAGRLDVIVFWEASRGGRELVAWAELLEECRARKVKIYITSHDRLYNLSHSRDWRSLAEDGIDSAYESEKVSDRVRRAMEANAQAGRPHGRVLFGYRRVYDPLTRVLARQEADPRTAWIPREIITRIAAGESLTAIMRDFRERGVPTPDGAPWDQTMIRRIASNPAYIGMRSWQPKGAAEPGLVPATMWDPVADETDFRDAQAILAARKGSRPGITQRHLLSYLALCGKCGGKLHSTKGRGPVRVYACKDSGCVVMREDWLDAYVTGHLCARLDTPEFWDELLNGDSPQARAARARELELKQRLDGLKALAVAGRIDPGSYADMEADLLPRIRAAAGRSAQVTVSPLLMQIRKQTGAHAVRDVFERSPMAVRKQVIRELYDGIILLPPRDRGRQFAFDPRRVRMVAKGYAGTRA